MSLPSRDTRKRIALMLSFGFFSGSAGTVVLNKRFSVSAKMHQVFAMIDMSRISAKVLVFETFPAPKLQ